MLQGAPFASSDRPHARGNSFSDAVRRHPRRWMIGAFVAGMIVTFGVLAAIPQGTPGSAPPGNNAGSNDAGASAYITALGPIVTDHSVTYVTTHVDAVRGDCGAIRTAVGYGVQFYPNSSGQLGTQSRQFYHDMQVIAKLGCQGPFPRSGSVAWKRLDAAIRDADNLAWVLS